MICQYISCVANSIKEGNFIDLITQFISLTTNSVVSSYNKRRLIMEHKVEKFQMNTYFAASTLPYNGTQEKIYKSSKPVTVLRKRSSQFTEVLPTELLKRNMPTEEAGDDNVALNLCPDGSEINISINGTTLNATKTSLNITIGNFTININSLIKEHAPMPSLMAVFSITQGTPLHVVLGDSPDVRATLPFSKLNC